MAMRIILELVITAAIAVIATRVYMIWYGDVVASFVGYPIAVFAVPFVAGISIGIVFRQAMCALTTGSRNLWQFCGVGAISALALPVLYLWAVYQPH